MRSDAGYFVSPEFGVLRRIIGRVYDDCCIVETLQCGHTIAFDKTGFDGYVQDRRCGACAAEQFIALVRMGVDLRA